MNKPTQADWPRDLRCLPLEAQKVFKSSQPVAHLDKPQTIQLRVLTPWAGEAEELGTAGPKAGLYAPVIPCAPKPNG
jgi:hypothetical protein